MSYNPEETTRVRNLTEAQRDKVLDRVLLWLEGDGYTPEVDWGKTYVDVPTGMLRGVAHYLWDEGQRISELNKDVRLYDDERDFNASKMEAKSFEAAANKIWQRVEEE